MGPTWGSLNVRDVRIIAVENWFDKLLRGNGNPIGPFDKSDLMRGELFALKRAGIEFGSHQIKV